MNIIIKKSDLKENLYSFLRKCGYSPFHDSYVRLLSRSGYPRFHLYPKDDEGQYILSLHLDQKRPSYGKETAHSGEYEGSIVEEEAKRIENFV